jgi:hypothetical protein
MPTWHNSEPLSWAASFGQLGAVQALVVSKADPNRSPNQAGFTPLQDAEREQHSDVSFFLRRVMNGEDAAEIDIAQLGDPVGPDEAMKENSVPVARSGKALWNVARAKLHVYDIKVLAQPENLLSMKGLNLNISESWAVSHMTPIPGRILPPSQQQMDGTPCAEVSATELGGLWAGLVFGIFPWCSTLQPENPDVYRRGCQCCAGVPLCGRRYVRVPGTNRFNWDRDGTADNEMVWSTRFSSAAEGLPACFLRLF